MKNLEYHFIRTEADNKITLFLKVNKEIIGEELDITLTNNNELQIILEEDKETRFKTNVLPDLLYDNLQNKNTLVVFCDEEANFLAETVLPPL